MVERARRRALLWCAALGATYLGLAFQLSRGPWIPLTVGGLARAVLSTRGADGAGAASLFVLGAVVAVFDAVLVWTGWLAARIAVIAIWVLTFGVSYVTWFGIQLAGLPSAVAAALICAFIIPLGLLQWLCLRRFHEGTHSEDPKGAAA